MTNWETHKAADGRVYYYNRETKKSSWEKPDELKTIVEIKTKWKEYVAPGGKKYWYNSETKETTWNIPDEYEKLERGTANTTDISASYENISVQGSETQSQIGHSLKSTSAAPETSNQVSENNSNVVLPSISQIKTKKDSENAFKMLLSHKNIRPEWTWEQAIRVIISHPLYNCLEPITERKRVFREYCEEAEKKEQEIRKAERKERRARFYRMLDELPLTEDSRFRKVEILTSEREEFLAIHDSNERVSLFEDYMDSYLEILDEMQYERRKYYAKELDAVMNSFEKISVYTKWFDFKKSIQEHPRVLQLIDESNNPEKSKILSEMEFQKILEKKKSKGDDSGIIVKRNIVLVEPVDNLDFLEAFQRKISNIEKEYMEKLENQRKQRVREARKARDAFKELLNEHLVVANITPVSLWMDFYPLIKDDTRYINVLGQLGSTPLELFWDHVEELNDKVYHQRKVIEEHIREQYILIKKIVSDGGEEPVDMIKITSKTELGELEKYLTSDRFLKSAQGKVAFDNYAIPYIHEQLLIKARRREEEETKKTARGKKKALEYTIHILKSKLDPRLNSSSVWEKEKEQILLYPGFPSDFVSEAECEALFNDIVDQIRSAEKDRSPSPEPGEYVSKPRKSVGSREGDGSRSSRHQHDERSYSRSRVREDSNDRSRTRSRSSGRSRGRSRLLGGDGESYPSKKSKKAY
ncbi:hypothetical protein BB558_000306 [Smittium angustum]|uniref:Uncharacterized protein n=1 Tax=Smittium angustum TaxID=133377 RepID=A0A2U1JEG4_SMIAN|nr:hypothetical protein BB558_000306 [Smittium angustum]